MLSVEQDKRTVREIKFPKEELEVIQRIKDSKTINEDTKVRIARKLTGGPCSCGALPTHEIVYPGDKKWYAKPNPYRVRYCSDCLKKEYSLFQGNSG